MVLLVIEVKSRAVPVAGIRIAPDGAWMLQMARNLLDSKDGFLRNASHLIHDRDPLYNVEQRQRNAWPDRMPVASRWAAQLLPSQDCVRTYDKFADTTS
jgi:hypothetical protein